MTPDELRDTMDRAAEAIHELGLENASAMLGEGFCPVCRIRSSDQKIIDDEEDPRPETTAEVNCAQCATRWRSGPSLHDLPFVDITRNMEGKLGRVYMTLTLNPPPDEDPWVDDDEFDNDDEYV